SRAACACWAGAGWRRGPRRPTGPPRGAPGSGPCQIGAPPATAAPAHQTARRYELSQTSPGLCSVSTTHSGANLLLAGPALSAIGSVRARERSLLLVSERRVPLVDDLLHLTGEAYQRFLRGNAFLHEFFLELLEEPFLVTAVRDLEEVSVEQRELAGPEVAFLHERVAFQEVSAFAEHLASRDVVLHDRRHPEALDRAGLHTDGAPIVARHDRPAALVDELILLDATPPHLLLDEGTTRATVHTDLTDLTELVDTVVDGLVVGHRRVSGDNPQSGSGAEMGREQLTVGTQLSQPRSHEHGNVRGAVVIGAMHLGVIPELPDVVGEIE